MGIKEELQKDFDLTIEEIELEINSLGFDGKKSAFSEKEENVIIDHFATKIFNPDPVVTAVEEAGSQTAQRINKGVHQNIHQMEQAAIERITQVIAHRTHQKLEEIFSDPEQQQAVIEEVQLTKKNPRTYLPNYLAAYNRRSKKQLPGSDYLAITPGQEEN